MSRQCSSPTLDLKLNLSPPSGYQKQIQPPNLRPSSWEFSADDHESSCVSSEAEENYDSSGSDEMITSMVLVGCPRCLMYVMLSGVDPKCPKCKSSVLLNVFEGPIARK